MKTWLKLSFYPLCTQYLSLRLLSLVRCKVVIYILSFMHFIFQYSVLLTGAAEVIGVSWESAETVQTLASF